MATFDSARDGSRIVTWLLLTTVLLAGALLRFVGLEIQSLWNDELSSWAIASGESAGEIIRQLERHHRHPPLFHLMQHVLNPLLGDSEWALRLPSAFFGFLSVLSIYLLGVRLYSTREGLIAAALMALGWFPIYHSQEARPYAMLLFLSIWTSAFWLAIVRSVSEAARPRWAVVLGYVICALASAYLHYFGLLLVGLQAVGLAVASWRKPHRLPGVIALYGVIALLYAPWLPVLFTQVSQDGSYWIPPPGVGFPYEMMRSFSGGSDALAVAALLIYATALTRWALRLRCKEADWKSSLGLTNPDFALVLWLVAPLLLGVLLSLCLAPLLTARNMIIVLPAVYLLLARCICLLPFGRAAQTAVAAAVCLTFVGGLFFEREHYRPGHKEQFREVIDELDANRDLLDDSVLVACAWSKRYFDYYLEKRGLPRRVDLLLAKASHIETLERWLAANNPKYIWFLRGHREPEPQIQSYLRTRHRLVFQKKLYGADVMLFERKGRLRNK